MKTLPAALVPELAKEIVFTARLLEIDASTALRYTDLDISVLLDGYTYEARAFEAGGAEYSLDMTIDSVSVRVDDVAGDLTSLFLTQELRKKRCVVKLAGLDENAKVIAAAPVFAGIVDSIDGDVKRVTIEVTSPMILWKTKTPRRTHTATCPYPFKSADADMPCLYAGAETWCDQTYARCLALGNDLNFGGFRYLPSLVNKQIWWGQKPK